MRLQSKITVVTWTQDTRDNKLGLWELLTQHTHEWLVNTQLDQLTQYTPILSTYNSATLTKLQARLLEECLRGAVNRTCQPRGEYR